MVMQLEGFFNTQVYKYAEWVDRTTVGGATETQLDPQSPLLTK